MSRARVARPLTGLEVEDHVERLPVVRHLLVQSRQVKLVLNVILVHLAEKLISAQSAEPRNPRYFLRAAHRDVRTLPAACEVRTLPADAADDTGETLPAAAGETRGIVVSETRGGRRKYFSIPLQLL